MKYREFGKLGWQISDISFGAWAVLGLFLATTFALEAAEIRRPGARETVAGPFQPNWDLFQQYQCSLGLAT
jgi:aryl-alcohol dehydrogenase-like predicted oxidoreductase